MLERYPNGGGMKNLRDDDGGLDGLSKDHEKDGDGEKILPHREVS